MPIQFIIAGLSLGILSSFHCAGMCGPLVMALPVNHFSSLQKALALFLYHTGRILIYMSLGFLFASFGRGIYIAGWQQYLSIGLGVTMILLTGYYLFFKNARQPSFINKLYEPVYRLMGHNLNTRKFSGFLTLGIFNGLLPCGMVYLAIAGALSAGKVSEGVLFMGAYGLGTLPALLLLSLFSFHLSIPLRNNIKKVFPVIAAAMGILLILRGMGLGIPYVSPVLPEISAAAVYCQ